MSRPISTLSTLVFGLALVACGRGGLWLGDADQEGAGGPGSGAGGPGSGAGAPGSGAAGSGAGAPGSGAGGPGSGGSSTGSSSTGSSSTGSSSSGSGGGDPVTCPSLGDSCTNCASQNCPDTWCGCYNNPGCFALLSCFGDCNGNGACEDACMVTHQGAISDVILLSGCAGTTCSSVCDWGDAEFSDCEECIFNDCATEMNACLVVPDCGALWQCFGTCGDLDLTCQANCYSTYPGGIQQLETALQCVVNLCERPCE